MIQGEVKSERSDEVTSDEVTGDGPSTGSGTGGTSDEEMSDG